MSLKKNLFFIIFLTITILWIVIFVRTFFFIPSGVSFLFSSPKESLVFAEQELSEMQLLHQERFEKEFSNLGGNIYQFLLYIKKVPLYFPYIESQLEKRNLPDDLKYIAIVESALRDDVVSPVGAAGIWQFMPETAKQYWLKITDEVDERFHFEKSTQAALTYLEFLYNKFQDWPLAIASYNRGQNAIQKALIDQNVTNFFDLNLNDETSRYFFKIVAVKYILQDYQKRKWSIDALIWTQNPIPMTQKISVWNIPDLKIWAQEKNYNYEMLKHQNKWILWNSLPQWDWEIEIIVE